MRPLILAVLTALIAGFNLVPQAFAQPAMEAASPAPHAGQVHVQALQALADGGQAATRSILDQGEKAGDFRTIDARFLQVALVGACGFFITARPFVEALFKGQRVNTATAEAYGEFVADLILEGLKRPGTRRAR